MKESECRKEDFCLLLITKGLEEIRGKDWSVCLAVL